MKSILKKKSYYIITHPDWPSAWMENYGDREFRFRSGRSTTTHMDVSLGGDIHWPITKQNILLIGDYLFEQHIAQKKAELEQIRVDAEQAAKKKKRWKEILTLRWF